MLHGFKLKGMYSQGFQGCAELFLDTLLLLTPFLILYFNSLLVLICIFLLVLVLVVITFVNLGFQTIGYVFLIIYGSAVIVLYLVVANQSSSLNYNTDFLTPMSNSDFFIILSGLLFFTLPEIPLSKFNSKLGGCNILQLIPTQNSITYNTLDLALGFSGSYGIFLVVIGLILLFSLIIAIHLLKVTYKTSN